MRVLSGMRPTGRLHLGHLAGVLSQWRQIQDKYECLFMSADLHALLSEYKDPSQIKDYSLDNIADWLSWGISPEKSIIFIQSQVKEHLELFFIFSSFTPLGWLTRCPTFKDQVKQLKEKDVNNLGFLGYPVLQAADILIYRADYVPVGEDQLPHLELTREIARRFNFLYKKEFFPYPQPLLSPMPKLLGTDGRKMSKSYGNCIYLSDSTNEVKAKVKNMFTDPQRIKKSQPGRPEVCNVYSYYELFSPENKEAVAKECQSAAIGCTDCKKRLAEILEQLIAPAREKRQQLLLKKDFLLDIVSQGSKKAKAIAENTLSQVKNIMPFC